MEKLSKKMKSGCKDGNIPLIEECIKGGWDVTAPIEEGLPPFPYVKGIIERSRSNPKKTKKLERAAEFLSERASKLARTAVVRNDPPRSLGLFKFLGADMHQVSENEPFGLVGLAALTDGCVPESIDTLLQMDRRNMTLIEKIDEKDQSLYEVVAKAGHTELSLHIKTLIDKRLLAVVEASSKIPDAAAGGKQVSAATTENRNKIIFERISRLAKVGGDLESLDDAGRTLLSMVIMNDNVLLHNDNSSLVSHLLSIGANLRHKGSDGKTAFDIALEHDPRNARLIQRIKAHEKNCKLIEIVEIKGKDLEVVDFSGLVNEGADIRHRDSDGNTILHLAVLKGVNSEIVDELVTNFGADIESKNNAGERPLDLAVQCDETCLTVMRLMGMGAKLVRKTPEKLLISRANDAYNEPAATCLRTELDKRLWTAVFTGNMDSIRELVEAGANIDADTDKEELAGSSPLCYAASQRNLSVTKLLVSLNANVNHQDANGCTPVALACTGKFMPIVKHLVESGADINIVMKNGDSPLHCAAAVGEVELVLYLVKYGARVDAVNGQSMKAVDVARKEEEESCKDVVVELEKMTMPNDIAFENRCFGDAPTDDIDLSPLAVLPTLTKPSEKEEEEIAKRVNRRNTMKKRNPYGDIIKAINNCSVPNARSAIQSGLDIRAKVGDESLLTHVLQKVEQMKAHSQKVMLTPGLGMAEVQSILDKVGSLEKIYDLLIENSNKKVEDSVRTGDLVGLQSLHKAGASLNSANHPSCGPLGLIGLAVSGNLDSAEVVDFLVSNNDSCRKALTDRMVIAKGGYATPLSLSQASGLQRIAQYIHWKLSSELKIAVEKENMENVRMLRQAGALVRFQDSNGVEAKLVELAAKKGNFQLVELLLDSGAGLADFENLDLSQTSIPEPVKRIVDKWTREHGLRLAAARGDLKEVQNIHEKITNIEAPNCFGSTALTLCVANGDYFPVVHYLVSRGSALEHSDSRHKTLIRLAQEKGSTGVAEYLQSVVNDRLLAAVRRGQMEEMEKLLSLGGSVDAHDSSDRSLLSYAVEYQGLNIVKWLCERGAPVHIPDGDGMYPLGRAAQKGDYALVEYICEQNLSVKDLKNRDDKTAYDISVDRRFEEIAKFLRPSVFTVPSEGAVEPVATQQSAVRFSRDVLLDAVRNANMETIHQFVNETYPSIQKKIDDCEAMLEVAREYRQKQVELALAPVLSSLMSAKLSDVRASIVIDSRSGAPAEGGAAPSAQSGIDDLSSRVMKGLFVGMTANIGGSDLMDIRKVDPHAFEKLLGSMTTRIQGDNEKIENVRSQAELASMLESERESINQQLQSMTSEIQELRKYEMKAKEQMVAVEARMQGTSSAKERVEAHKELQELRDHLAEMDAQQSVLMTEYNRNEERKEVMEMFREHPNMLLFYRTLATKLEEVFVSAKAGAGGFVTLETKSATRATVGILGTMVSIIPLVGSPVEKLLFKAAGIGLKALDKKRQAATARNISMLATMAEVQKICDLVAGRLTLSFAEQINKLQDPEEEETRNEPAAKLMAEFAVYYLIKALRSGTLSPTGSVQDQLTWIVLSHNPFANKSWRDKLGKGLGGKKVMSKDGEAWELRNVFGCPGVRTDDGKVFGGSCTDIEKYGTIHSSLECAQARELAEIDKVAEITEEEMNHMAVFSGVGVDSIDPSSEGISKQKHEKKRREAKSSWTKGPRAPTFDENIDASLEKRHVDKDSLQEYIREENNVLKLETESKFEILNDYIKENVQLLQDKFDVLEGQVGELVNKTEADVDKMQTEANEKIQNELESVSKQQAENLKLLSEKQQELNKEGFTELTQILAKQTEVQKEELQRTSNELEINVKSSIDEKHTEMKNNIGELLEKVDSQNTEIGSNIEQAQQLSTKIERSIEEHTIQFKELSEKITKESEEAVKSVIDLVTVRNEEEREQVNEIHKKMVDEHDRELDELKGVIAKIESSYNSFEEKITSQQEKQIQSIGELSNDMLKTQEEKLQVVNTELCEKNKGILEEYQKSFSDEVTAMKNKAKKQQKTIEKLTLEHNEKLNGMERTEQEQFTRHSQKAENQRKLFEKEMSNKVEEAKTKADVVKMLFKTLEKDINAKFEEIKNDGDSVSMARDDMEKVEEAVEALKNQLSKVSENSSRYTNDFDRRITRIETSNAGGSDSANEKINSRVLEMEKEMEKAKNSLVEISIHRGDSDRKTLEKHNKQIEILKNEWKKEREEYKKENSELSLEVKELKEKMGWLIAKLGESGEIKIEKKEVEGLDFSSIRKEMRSSLGELESKWEKDKRGLIDEIHNVKAKSETVVASSTTSNEANELKKELKALKEEQTRLNAMIQSQKVKERPQPGLAAQRRKRNAEQADSLRQQLMGLKDF